MNWPAHEIAQLTQLRHTLHRHPELSVLVGNGYGKLIGETQIR